MDLVKKKIGNETFFDRDVVQSIIEAIEIRSNDYNGNYYTDISFDGQWIKEIFEKAGFVEVDSHDVYPSAGLHSSIYLKCEELTMVKMPKFESK